MGHMTFDVATGNSRDLPPDVLTVVLTRELAERLLEILQQRLADSPYINRRHKLIKIAMPGEMRDAPEI